MAEPSRTVTPSGTEILIEPMPHARSVSLGFWVRRGSRHEATHEEGLAHFLEHTVFKGTATLPTPDAVAEATDRLGGHVDAFTGKEVACFYGRVLEDQLPDLTSLLGELVTSPRFDEAELSRERGVILEEIAMSEDQPDDWVSELFYMDFWKDSPLAHPILGRRDQVAGYGAEAARAFFRDTYRAGNLVIAAAGAVTPESLMPLLEPILAQLPEGGHHEIGAVAPTRPFLLNAPKKGLQQTNLVLGFPAPSHTDGDRTVVSLLSHILGGGMASRLFMELRERRGLCYQVGSFHTPYADTGALQISAGCAPAQARELVSRAMAECLKLRSNLVPAEELERAKRQAKVGLVFGQESAASRMFSIAHQSLHWGGPLSLDAQLAEIEAVTPEDLRRVADAILRPETLGLAALGIPKAHQIRASDLVA
ncbi:MAG TPA: pitrilysin family protein [Holophagaceae bacterium]|nr:pitrilysin family protein [Holophagaceae bacterium]